MTQRSSHWLAFLLVFCFYYSSAIRIDRMFENLAVYGFVEESDNNCNPIITVPDSLKSTQCVTDSIVLSVEVSDSNWSDDLVVSFYARPKKKTSQPFTLIGLPDTQYYTGKLNGGSNAIFKSQTNWIVANKDALNIAHTMHLGDCVEEGDNGGNDVEWRRVDTAMSIIENAATTHVHDGMSYTMCVGNHDQSPFGSASGTSVFYNQFFGVNRFAGRYYWGGNYGQNADNNYQLFSASGLDFIVISLEFDPQANPAVIAWADSLLKVHSNRSGIIVSHFLINTGGYYGVQGAAIYQGLKNNPNLFLMLSGHVAGEGVRSISYNGNTIHTILADFQDRNDGGDGWMRIMDIDPWSKIMEVKTYSPWLNQYETDANSQFTLSNLNLPGSPGAFTLLHTDTLTGAGTASYNWKNLPMDSAYQWYVVVSDGTVNTESSIYEFHTSVVSYHYDTICPGDSVLIAGEYQSTAGIYSEVITRPGYCDSVVNTEIAIVNKSSCAATETLDSIVIVSDNHWMKSTVTNTAEAAGHPWLGVSGLPGLSTFSLPVEMGQPKRWHSIDSVDGAYVIKSGNGITFFRTTFDLISNTGATVEIRGYMDDGMEIYLNGYMLAREDDRDATNASGFQHHLKILEDGSYHNGYANDDRFDVVGSYPLDSVLQIGSNELIIALRNAPKASDNGGFSFRADIKTGIPILPDLVEYIVTDAGWTKSTVSTVGGSSWNWPGVSDLPDSSTFTEFVEIGQPYRWNSIAEVDEASVIKAGNNVTFYRKEFELSDSKGVNARIRATFDENLQIFINEHMIAGQYQHGAINRNLPAHDLYYQQGGAPVNGYAGGDVFMQVENVDFDDILRKGNNNITVALQNRANDKGGFSLRLDLDKGGSSVIRKTEKAIPKEGYNSDLIVFDLYPNPTKSKVFLELVKSPSQENEILIYDINGRLLDKVSMDRSDQSMISFDFGSYAAGLYLIKVQTPDGAGVGKRLIKY